MEASRAPFLAPASGSSCFGACRDDDNGPRAPNTTIDGSVDAAVMDASGKERLERMDASTAMDATTAQWTRAPTRTPPLMRAISSDASDRATYEPLRTDRARALGWPPR